MTRHSTTLVFETHSSLESCQYNRVIWCPSWPGEVEDIDNDNSSFQDCSRILAFTHSSQVSIYVCTTGGVFLCITGSVFTLYNRWCFYFVQRVVFFCVRQAAFFFVQQVVFLFV